MRKSTCWRSAVTGSVLAVTILTMTVFALPAAAESSGPGAESTPEKPGTAAIMAMHSPRPKAAAPAKAATAHQLAFRNAVVPARSSYVYDALYQLRSASGRERASQSPVAGISRFFSATRPDRAGRE